MDNIYRKKKRKYKNDRLLKIEDFRENKKKILQTYTTIKRRLNRKEINLEMK